MDGSLRFLFSACCLLTVAVVGCRAQCTQAERTQMFDCLLPYNDRMVGALGTSGSCRRDAITSNDLCSAFGNIVHCMNCLPVSDTQCRPVGVQTVNAGLIIPCRVEDFVDVCTDAPFIYEGKANTSNPCSSSGSAVPTVTFVLVLTTVTAAVLCVL